MRNKVAKSIRRQVGEFNAVKNNTSDQLLYKELKREHNAHTQNPVFKENRRAEKRGFASTPLQQLAFKKWLRKWKEKTEKKK